MNSTIVINHPIKDELLKKHYTFVNKSDFSIPQELKEEKERFLNSWNDLESDNYLKDGKKYRLRRFLYFYWNPVSSELLPFRNKPYFQESGINQYAGGIERHFAPLTDDIIKNGFLNNLILTCWKHLPVSNDKFQQTWRLEIHQVRIIATNEELGEPTPEGIHRDGDDFGWVFITGRENVIGGISGIYTNDRKEIAKKCMQNVLDGVVLWDEKIMHDVSPIAIADSSKDAYRDILIVSFTHVPDLERPNKL